jgi:hypothetical protein
MAQHVTLTTRARKPDRLPPREELLNDWERSVGDRLGTSFAAAVDELRRGIDPDTFRRHEPDRQAEPTPAAEPVVTFGLRARSAAMPPAAPTSSRG